jgi:hypothetical protein
MAAKRIFVVCPIGDEDSKERKRSDNLLKFVIHPVVAELGLPPEEALVRSDKIGTPGRITIQILRQLVEADVVVADLTETNPNVMYEVGIRQALLKPFVLMAEKGLKLPFDLSDLRTVFYRLELEEVEEAKKELKSHLEKALSGEISHFDQALFASQRSDGASPSDAAPRDLLAVLEVCQTILKETQETKSLVNAVGSIALEARDSKEEVDRIRQEGTQQQMGLMLMSQFLQNPEGFEKLMPALEKLAEFGQGQKRVDQAIAKGGRKRK